jgi:hypothetical protein
MAPGTWALLLGLAAAPQGKVAVLDVQATGVDDALVGVLTEVLTTEVQRSGRFQEVIAGRDVKAMLSFEERRQILGCSDEACLAEIGGALGADRIVVSSVGKVGDSFLVTVKLIDIQNARTDGRAYRRVAPERLLEGIQLAVQDLFHTPEAGPSAGADVLAPAPRPLPVLPLALFGVAAAGVGVGVGFGLDAKARRDHAQDPTYVGGQAEIARGKTSMILANVGYGVAGAAALTGALLWLLGGEGADAPVVAPAVGAGGAGLVVGGRL